MNPSICQEESEIRLRADIAAWFAGPLGLSLQAMEAHRLRSILPPLYATTALQLGSIGRMDLLDASPAPTRIVMDARAQELPHAVVRGVPEELPFDAKSVSMALLPHTLDFSVDPHQVLREVHRVLTPEGHLVVIGFNPISLWGLWRLFKKRGSGVPWCAKFLRLPRVKDWLALLDFEPIAGSMLFYRPPLSHERTMERLHFMEQTGDRWWPLAAAVYVIVAKKRVVGLTPIRPRLRKRRFVGDRVTQPVAKSG